MRRSGACSLPIMMLLVGAVVAPAGCAQSGAAKARNTEPNQGEIIEGIVRTMDDGPRTDAPPAPIPETRSESGALR